MMVYDPTHRTARVYVQVADKNPRGAHYWSHNATVVKTTTQPPEIIEPGCVVIPIDIRVPRTRWNSGFGTPITVDVPEADVQEAATASYVAASVKPEYVEAEQTDET